MADLFRDSSFGQVMRLVFNREIAPFEDEKRGFDMSQTFKKPDEDNQSESHVSYNDGSSRDSFDSGRSGDDDDDSYDGISSRPSFDSSRHDEKRKPSKGPRSSQRRKSSYKKEEWSTHHSQSDVDEAGAGSQKPRIVTFTPNDPDNPQNWSALKKNFTYFQICILTFVIYGGSAIITPAYMSFMMEFGVSQQAASLSLSMYVLGYGIGPLLFSPLSEIPYLGRNLSYMSSYIIFLIVTAIGSGISNFPAFIVMRFLQGFFGGPVLATGSGSAQDIFAFHKVPLAMAVWAEFVFAAPALGPVMSGYAISLGTWRWGMWETLIQGVVVFFLLFFCLPETNAEYILTQRAKRLRARTGDQNIKTEAEAATEGKNVTKNMIWHLGMPFKISFADPSIFFINMYTALMYSTYYSFFESFPLVYEGVYKFSVGAVGLVFISVLIGGFIGLAIYVSVFRGVYEPYALVHGIGNPEWRLFPGCWGAAFQPVALFIFGYASKATINWPNPTMGIALFAASSFITLNCIFTYLPLSYPRYAASVFAANGFWRSALAAAAIHFSQPMFKNIGVGNGCAVIGGSSALFAMFFCGLYVYGGKLRARSSFAG